MKLAMVFPGQGSQAVGMLKGYAGLPEIDAVRADVAAVLGGDFLRLLDEGPAEDLGLTGEVTVRKDKTIFYGAPVGTHPSMASLIVARAHETEREAQVV